MNLKLKATWGLAVLAVAFAVAVLFVSTPELRVYAQGAGVVDDFANENSVTPTHSPGFVYTDKSAGTTYQYVQFDNGAGDVAVTAGAVVYVKTLATYVVTGDISDSLTTQGNSVCGIVLGVITDQRYCWILVRGPYATLDTDGDDDIAIGDAIIGLADVICESVASGTAPTHKVLGFATAVDVDADNTVPVHMTVGPM